MNTLAISSVLYYDNITISRIPVALHPISVLAVHCETAEERGFLLWHFPKLINYMVIAFSNAIQCICGICGTV